MSGGVRPAEAMPAVIHVSRSAFGGFVQKRSSFLAFSTQSSCRRGKPLQGLVDTDGHAPSATNSVFFFFFFFFFSSSSVQS